MLPSEETAEIRIHALYHDMAEPLFRFAVKLTGDRDRAEEVVQETLVRAWRQAGHLDLDSDRMRGWLFTVARNLITDLRRSDRARPITISDERSLSAASVADGVEQAVQGWALTEALHQLTHKHRVVLEAVYYEDRTIADAAQRLGLPFGTVKSRRHYALRALRHVLEEVEAV
ncbi:sigma-70 family RNA polymerase sigma factor [Pseudonocardia xinjiangensis]|uniref:sigma-70 family RNA polymerase sigma factor n=1 Tax=Pseudonocardia xinjiangensis TaxID=75289 RepID=UPI003D94D5D5